MPLLALGYLKITTVNEHSEVIQNHQDKSLLLNRLVGPFLEQPFVHYVSSLLSIVPKSDLGKIQIIHELSYPQNAPLNSMMPKGTLQAPYMFLLMILLDWFFRLVEVI